MTALLWVYLALAITALTPELLYVIRYHTKSRGAWRDSYLGRTMMLKASVIVLLLANIVFNTSWLLIAGSGHPLRIPIGMSLFVAFAFALWRQWLSFEKVQKEKDEEEKRHGNVQ